MNDWRDWVDEDRKEQRENRAMANDAYDNAVTDKEMASKLVASVPQGEYQTPTKEQFYGWLRTKLDEQPFVSKERPDLGREPLRYYAVPHEDGYYFNIENGDLEGRFLDAYEMAKKHAQGKSFEDVVKFVDAFAYGPPCTGPGRAATMIDPEENCGRDSIVGSGWYGKASFGCWNHLRGTFEDSEGLESTKINRKCRQDSSCLSIEDKR